MSWLLTIRNHLMNYTIIHIENLIIIIIDIFLGNLLYHKAMRLN